VDRLDYADQLKAVLVRHLAPEIDSACRKLTAWKQHEVQKCGGVQECGYCLQDMENMQRMMGVAP
jgi:hypothetical protein